VVCLAVTGPVVGAAFDGTYTGKMVLTKGNASSCPTQEDVSVTITDGIMTFTNSALRNFAMGFEPHPDGSFSQVHVDIGGDVVDIRGRIVGDTLDADVANAPCEHHWHLQKKLTG
jgi:hypothetical protein